ncbi:PaaI family thioesterase, partial [Salmonella enterica subsp. enterica serovar Havana]|nr:PaaI family thioesterase [Salmonella enterica subsp. enterica serovar Montevideo]EDS6479203.1 PaaI family thioesterase [Salmonella enterica subsp. enterica]EDV0840482.1 PaaI family thioesterase [Salmonella enterica subsp. enterica serovar Havana]EDW4014802.1 PaaI family thioesterase [Salmonella enterica subsp. enterica serovar Havana]EEA8078169.1 PaaI family thioesterase [Salmonella enterica subsp. enterica serovar Orion]
MNCYLDARKAHTCCMVCSSRDNNPDTVNLMFSEHPDGSVCADYTANHRHQGYTGLLHGGMTSTLLDAAMTH